MNEWSLFSRSLQCRWNMYAAVFAQSNMLTWVSHFLLLFALRLQVEWFMEISNQHHLLRVFQRHQMKYALYLGAELRENPNDPRETQENAGLTWGTANIFPSLCSKPTLHALLKSILERKPRHPGCGPFFNPQNTDFPSVYFSTGLFKGWKEIINEKAEVGWFFVLFREVNPPHPVSLTCKLWVLD